MEDEKFRSMGKFETPGLAHIFSLGNLLVPPNQRKYEWDIKEVGTLWEDIRDNILQLDEKSTKHFFGPFFFVKKPEDKNYYILDWQQRLATVTILLAIIRDVVYSVNDPIYEKPSSITSFFDKYIQLRDSTNISRDLAYPILILGKGNKEFFRDNIQRIGRFEDKVAYSRTSIGASNKLIKKIYRFLLEKLYFFLKGEESEYRIKWDNDKLIEFKNLVKREESKKKIMDIYKALMELFYVLKIEVEDPFESLEIFESLNDKGKKLFIYDVFKNYLFVKTGNKEETKIVEDEWNQIVEILENLNVNPDKFLRDYWLANKDFVRKKDLTKEMKKEIKKYDTDKLINFLKDMKSFANYYKLLINPDPSDWNGNKEIPNLINELNIFGITQPRPLIITVMKKCEQSKIRDFLKILRDLSFRSYTMLTQNPNELEEKWSEFALDLKSDKTTVDHIIDELEKRIPKDSEFKREFLEKDVETNIAKYILTSINNKMLGKGIITDPKITIEHIIPQTLDDWWKRQLQLESLEHEDCINRLGNFTLLDEDDNQKIKNTDYPSKYKVYSESKLPITNHLKNSKDWNKESLLKREEFFAEKATDLEVWGKY